MFSWVICIQIWNYFFFFVRMLPGNILPRPGWNEICFQNEIYDIRTEILFLQSNGRNSTQKAPKSISLSGIASARRQLSF